MHLIRLVTGGPLLSRGTHCKKVQQHDVKIEEKKKERTSLDYTLVVYFIPIYLLRIAVNVHVHWEHICPSGNPSLHSRFVDNIILGIRVDNFLETENSV